MQTIHNNHNMTLRPIELLAPAKNLECGIVAIDHGADAVYIGANAFGARQAAGNSIDDISQLVAYAHKFGAKVYVTVNTIVYEHELGEAKKLLENLIDIRVDAILVQDMAVVEIMKQIAASPKYKDIKLPQLHASTQTDNRNSNKVAWLASVGFSRVVLARELSLNEIRDIHNENPNVELEVFVHGALCVSYSGACYASEHCFHRSANRGECAQFCRLAFDLTDKNGDVIKHNSHLLSLKDMKQIDRLDDIIEAGATSLKIEGRLKDATYVKNVVAAYSQQINLFIEKNRNKYRRSSFGKSVTTFTPQLEKTFNRGFTNYFLDGHQKDISSFDTPKAMGEYVGYVKEIRHGSFNVAGTAFFSNGDGLCFFDENKRLEGFRVNKVDNNRLFPLTMPRSLKPGMVLYRNNDIEFERVMAGKTAQRHISVDFVLGIHDHQLYLKATDECQRSATVDLKEPLQEAQKPQRENIVRQLEKLGGTIFCVGQIDILDGTDHLFVPSSKLAALRREVIGLIDNMPITNDYVDDNDKNRISTDCQKLAEKDGDTIEAAKINVANVANHMAEAFYEQHGVAHATTAYEITNKHVGSSRCYGTPHAVTPLMTCRYCLRYAMGYCIKRGGKQPSWKEPLFLVSSDGRRVKLTFNCQKCQMEVYGV